MSAYLIHGFIGWTNLIAGNQSMARVKVEKKAQVQANPLS